MREKRRGGLNITFKEPYHVVRRLAIHSFILLRYFELVHYSHLLLQ